MDRAFWRQIMVNNYELPEEESLVELTAELLDYLGSPDPELRDTFAYSILARWLVSYRYHTHEQLHEMVQILQANMRSDIGEQGTDSVFLRSYSALILSLVMYRDDRENFLDPLEVTTLMKHAISYLVEEQDLRAWIPGKGWGNAVSNAADLLKFLVHNDALAGAELEAVLGGIADKLVQPTQVTFQHDEDDRLAKTVMAIINRDELIAFNLIDWVKQFDDWKSEHDPSPAYDPVYNANYQNIKHFLRALLLHLTLAPSLPTAAREFEPELHDVLKEFML